MSTSENPAPTPASLHYPEKSAGADHKMKAGTVVGIVIACIIVAIVATSAVLFAGPEPAPKQMDVDIVPTGMPKASAKLPGPLNSGPVGESPSGMANFVANFGSFPLTPPVGGGIPLASHEFPDGLELELVPGWTVDSESEDMSVIQLARDGANVLALIAVGTSRSDDIVEVLEGFISVTAESLENLEIVKGSGEQRDIEGQNFTQAYTANYTASVSSNQRTLELYGVFVQFFNPETQLFAFVDYKSDDQDTLAKYAEELDEMLGSIV